MLRVGSALKGYVIEASDGAIGSVGDFLFDDITWKVRWLVVETGSWLTGCKVLVHPSSIGKFDYVRQALSVSLTKTQVEDSPPILLDQPVSGQIQNGLFDYYGWDRLWGGSRFGALNSAPSADLDAAMRETTSFETHLNQQDPHLRSMVSVTGYHIHARDGAIGHVEDFLIDDAAWDIRYIIVDTKNWWPGQHVLLSAYAVEAISWSPGQVQLNVTRNQVKASPPWAPLDMIDQAYEKRLHAYYDWPGYYW